MRSKEYTYFISTQTYGRRSLFQVEKYAVLMVDVLKHYDGSGYLLHAYVVMPDHLHVLLTPIEAIEKSVQLIKGGFSFRIKREHGMNGEIWQPGFTDHRIRDSEDWERHLEYIRKNPVEARLVEDSVLYEWMGFPNKGFPQGLKPLSAAIAHVRAEARTLHPNQHLSDDVGTAEAVPFQSKSSDVARAGTEAAPFQSKGKSVESFADLRDKRSG
jgi:putative transposase